MVNLPRLTLVTGGAASGKSAFAQSLVMRSGRARVYVATAHVHDSEMAAKVGAHIASRGQGWRTIEAPETIFPALEGCQPTEAVLFECATMWLSNHAMKTPCDLAQATDALLHALGHCSAPMVVVSNELGQGIVPENALARRFRNAHGAMNQRLARQADWVFAVMAGLPFALKGPHPAKLA